MRTLNGSSAPRISLQAEQLTYAVGSVFLSVFMIWVNWTEH